MFRMGLSLQQFNQYTEEREDFMPRIVQETSFGCTPFNQNQKDLSWNGNIPPRQQKKFKTIPLARKVMLPMFWKQKFKPHGETVNAVSYCTTVRELLQVVHRKRSGLLTKRAILLHDNARPHTARVMEKLLRTFRLDRLKHSLYSPDLAPSDSHLFGPIKNHLGGRYYAAGFQGLVKRWDVSECTG